MNKKLVIPGDFLSDDVSKAGDGTYVQDRKVYSNLYGVASEKDKIRVVSLSGKYIPSSGDVIIGTVKSVTFSNWILDVNSPYEGWLNSSEYPRRIDSSDMSKYLTVGDSVMVMVKDLTPSMKIDLTMRNNRSRTINNGILMEISPVKVPRIIGRGGSMISMLKKETNCNIFVGQNGIIWLTGKDKDIEKAVNAITVIENEAHKQGLTERIGRLLKEGVEDNKAVPQSPDILNELLD
ncbi:MAG: exosome complex RNA-binding protein Rrp4 [ANME-2 cluster archaeon]|nr:exosome complex RNA-binding protein Rrp4 [ANME-2 cluster archaeon]